LTKPKADRLNLMRATNSNLEQIFFLYSDPENIINKILDKYALEKPIEEAIDHFGDKHSLWLVTNEKDCQAITNYLKEKQLFIADGHHRYETSCTFAREHGQLPGSEGVYAYRMATLVNMEDEGLTILPTHRLLHGLKVSEKDFIDQCEKYFKIEKYRNFKDLNQAMNNSKNKNVFGYYAGHDFYLLEYIPNTELNKFISAEHSEEWSRLDVAILHTIILEKILGIDKEKQAAQENITYMRYIDKALSLISSGQEQMGFFLNPTKIDQVKAVSLAGDVMPQKSTDFYPKLLSGMVFYKFPDGI